MMPACGNLFNDGGEGKIYEVVGNKDLLIKIYNDKDSAGNPIVTKELQHKLEYMKNHPPEVLIRKGLLAWPIDILYEQGKVTGLVMQKLIADASIKEMYSYKHPLIDKKYDSYPTVQSRIGIAINLVSAVSELHNTGYVIGDMNDQNIGIDRSTAQIRIFDCDSFTITDDSGITLRTNACMPGYLAPEIIRHCHSERAKGHPHELDTVTLPTFSKESDLFGLAVHIFRLLMNGVVPFNGVKNNATGSTAAPFVGNEGIDRNNYVFKQGLHPSDIYCLNPNEIPVDIKCLFDRAFLDGDSNPKRRPTTVEWYNALLEYLRTLKQCPNNPKHQYYNKLQKCPYCEADKRHYKIQNGTSQPKTTFNNQPAPKPIVLNPSNQIHNSTQNISNNSYKSQTSQPQHSAVSFTQQKTHKLRNILIGVAAVIICFVIWQKGKSKPDGTSTQSEITAQQTTELQKTSQTKNPVTTTEEKNNSNTAVSQKPRKTTVTAEPGETFSVTKYVSPSGLNVRSSPEAENKENIIDVLPQNSLVYLSDSSNGKYKGWVKIKYKDYTHIGWVDGTLLRDYIISNIQIGNHDNNGHWITKPGNTLYASTMEHLGITFDFDSLIYAGNEYPFYIKIINLEKGYIQGSNIRSGYSAAVTVSIEKGKHNYALGTFRIQNYYYISGEWLIEIYYKNLEKPIASKYFTIY